MEAKTVTSRDKSVDESNQLGSNGKPIAADTARSRSKLTGSIISATAVLPCTVGITESSKFDVSPRRLPLVLRNVLKAISTTASKHTLVGWTGPVLPSSDPDCSDSLLMPDHTQRPRREIGKLSNVSVRDFPPSDVNDAFLQHLRGKNCSKNGISIYETQRRGLETLLEHAFKYKIVPVWMGQWVDETRNELDLTDQARWRSIVAGNEWSAIFTGSCHDSQKSIQAFEDYKRFNRSMTDGILKVYQPGDIIWVHGDRLMLVPDMIRSSIPAAYIIFSQYTDWSIQAADTLNARIIELVKSVLQSSMVCMSNLDSREQLKSLCHHTLNIQISADAVVSDHGRQTRLLETFLQPLALSLQSDAVQKAEPEVEEWLSQIPRTFAGKRIILVQTRSHPFDLNYRLLTSIDACFAARDGPQFEAVFFWVTTNGHFDDQALRALQYINAERGSSIYQPLTYLGESPRHAEYETLLRLADLFILDANCESINILIQRFVIAQHNKHGLLKIIDSPSARAQFPAEQNGRIIISDDGNFLSIILRALNASSAEKRIQYDDLVDTVVSHQYNNFVDKVLSQAYAARSNLVPDEDVPILDQQQLTEQYAAASQRLFMFDYDGTLTPIVNDPDRALPTERLLSSLENLSLVDRNKIWIISGRSRAFLEKLFGHLKGIGLSAEHGSFIRRPGELAWRNLAATMDMGWKDKTKEAFQNLVDHVKGSWIECKEVAIVWHYRNAADHNSCLMRAVEIKTYLEGADLKSWDIEVMLGKANMEVRPKFLNKGVTAATLIDEVFHRTEQGFILCAGDDVTDEGMLPEL